MARRERGTAAGGRSCAAIRILALALALSPLLGPVASRPVAASGFSSDLRASLPALPRVGERMSTDDLSGIALKGFDPVAYHLEGRAVGGLAAHEASWAGVVWRFRTAANKAAFLADPAAFVPGFEGYDPVGVAASRAVESDPHEFALKGNRLFLFRSAETRRRFLADETLAALAEKAWPQVERQLAR